MEDAKVKEDIWMASKIIEEDESGELRLLQDNLEKLQRHLRLNESDVAALNIISVIGARDNENALLTNLLPPYLKKNGRTSWSNLLSKDGLGGFAFGTKVDKEESEMGSGENSNENGLLRVGNENEQRESTNEENAEILDAEISDTSLDAICASLEKTKLDHNQPEFLNTDDKNNDFEEAPVPEDSTVNVSGMNVLQRKQLYKMVCKLILHADILPPTCGDEISNVTKDLLSSARKFVEISMNVDDDVVSEEFVVVYDVSTYSQTFEDFMRCSEALLKSSKRILSEPNSNDKDFYKQEAECGDLIRSKCDDLHDAGQVGRDEGSSHVESSNFAGKGDEQQDNDSLADKVGQQNKSDHTPEKSGEQLENDKLLEKGDGKGDSNNSLVKGRGEVENIQMETTNVPDEKELNDLQVNNSIGENGNKNVQDINKQVQQDIITEGVESNDNQKFGGENITESCHPSYFSDDGNKQPSTSSKLFQLGGDKSAIYVYPEIIYPENDKKIKWCILHLHKTWNNDMTNEKLERFLLMVCSRIVLISNKEMTSAPAHCTGLDTRLHKKVFTVVIDDQEESIFHITEAPKYVQVTKDTFTVSHDGSGILNLPPKHLRTLSTLLQNITEFQIDTTKEADKKAGRLLTKHFTEYFTHMVDEFNVSSKEVGMKSIEDQKILQTPALEKTNEEGRTTPPLFSTRAENDKKVDAPVEQMGALTFSKIPEPPEDKINEIIEASIRKHWKELDQKLAEWIEKELDMENISNILPLYETWLKNITKNISKTRDMQKVNIKKIKESMKQRANEKCKPIIDDVIQGLDICCVYFRDQYEKKFSFPSHELEKELKEWKAKMLIFSEKREAIKLVSLGFEKLAKLLRNHNKKRLDAGKNISMETRHKIRNIYQEKMEHLLSFKISLDPKTLRDFHDELVSTLLATYEECVGNTIITVDDKESFGLNLSMDFQDYFDRNMLILEISQKKMKGHIGKSKNGYEEIMDNLLKANKSGIDPEKFNKEHMKASCKYEELLKTSIQTDEKLKEPIEKHMITLQKHIEKSYKTFKEDNEEFLKKSQNLARIGESENAEYGNSTNLQPKTSRKLKNNLGDHVLDDQSPKEPALKRFKRELPPLLYQISLGKVSIGTLSTSSWESNSAPPVSISSYPGIVGILMNGKWVCGDEVQDFNKRGLVQKFWKFDAIFDSYDFNDTVSINGDNIYITAPFLFGVFFVILKRKAENEQNGTISAAMISVPFWFSTYKRIQIEEAGIIAGFENIQLVNENTASAYFAYTNALSPPHQKMVVISENSNRVDISIFSYNQDSKTISMEGQSGDYETAELSKDKGFFKKFVTGTLLYLFYNQQETGIREKALESLEKVWDLAKSRVRVPVKLNEKSVLICGETDQWREFLWNFASKITNSEKISVRNDSPFLGLASLLHACSARKNLRIESLFKDANPFDVILAHSSQKITVEKKKNTFSTPVNQKYCFGLPQYSGMYSFSEDDFSPQRLGKFHLKIRPSYSFNIQAIFQRTRNGILKFTSAEYAVGSIYGQRKFLPETHFEWQPCKTNDETLGIYKSLMDQIKPQANLSNEVEQTLKRTEEMAKKIQLAIKGGAGNFKSSLGKNMVIKQIDDILEAITKEGVQEKQMKKHVTYLESIVQKYEL